MQRFLYQLCCFYSVSSPSVLCTVFNIVLSVVSESWKGRIIWGLGGGCDFFTFELPCWLWWPQYLDRISMNWKSQNKWAMKILSSHHYFLWKASCLKLSEHTKNTIRSVLFIDEFEPFQIVIHIFYEGLSEGRQVYKYLSINFC